MKTPEANTKCRLVEVFWNFWPAFQRWAESHTEGTSLTPQRTRILARLQEKGPQIMSELGEHLGVSATNVTALVDALEKDGFVARKPHPRDRRATIIEITSKASKEFSEGCSAYREKVADLFCSLTEAERKDLLRMMETLKERLATP
jgi:DNA-binding MarR family transcriptional regulator